MSSLSNQLKEILNLGSPYLRWSIPSKKVYMDHNHDMVFAVLYQANYHQSINCFIHLLASYSCRRINTFYGYEYELKQNLDNELFIMEKTDDNDITLLDETDDHDITMLAETDDNEIKELTGKYKVKNQHFLGTFVKIAREGKFAKFVDKPNGYMVTIKDPNGLSKLLLNLGFKEVADYDKLLLKLYSYGFDTKDCTTFTHPIWEGNENMFMPAFNNEFPFVTRMRYNLMFNGKDMKVYNESKGFEDILDQLTKVKNDFIQQDQNTIIINRDIMKIIQYIQTTNLTFSLHKFLYLFVDYGYITKFGVKNIYFINIFQKHGLQLIKCPKRNKKPLDDYKRRVQEFFKKKNIKSDDIENLSLSILINKNEDRIKLIVEDESEVVKIDYKEGIIIIDPNQELVTQVVKRQQSYSYKNFMKILNECGFILIDSSIDVRYYNPLVEKSGDLSMIKSFPNSSKARNYVNDCIKSDSDKYFRDKYSKFLQNTKGKERNFFIYKLDKLVTNEKGFRVKNDGVIEFPKDYMKKPEILNKYGITCNTFLTYLNKLGFVKVYSKNYKAYYHPLLQLHGDIKRLHFDPKVKTIRNKILNILRLNDKNKDILNKYTKLIPDRAN